MNQWGSEQYNMMPMMGTGHTMGAPALLPTPITPAIPGPHGGVPLLTPPNFLLTDWSQGTQSDGSTPFIGPVVPNNVDSTQDEGGNNENGSEQVRNKRESRDSRRDTEDRDRGDRGRRARSPRNRSNRDRNDRNERSRSDRRERRGPQRWSDSTDNSPGTGGLGSNMMMTGNNMMQYHNHMLNQQAIEMGNMQNLANMQNMPNMANMNTIMPGMNMMPNMLPNMMSNMMEQNMIMMQQMPMTMNNVHQPIYISSGVLLAPLPNATLPSRRERPPGCRTIFVGGLPHGTGVDVITEIFQRFGGIVDVKLHKQGVCHVRFEKQELVENSFYISGYRFKLHDQVENEATTIFIDYALNRDDQNESERTKRKRDPTPPRIESYTPAAFTTITDKIKSDKEFAEAAPTLAGWLERGECNKKNANAFYCLIQASNNQIRRLYNEKMAIDEEFQSVKGSLKDKFAHVIVQFEQVGKILTAAKMQRVSDHFSKQQRRNIEMWLKMTEDIENIKEEFNAMFDEDAENEEKVSKPTAIVKMYEELKVEHENLQHELEGFKNEAFLAKDEAERKFEKFKAHFIAQQALQQPGQYQVYPPLPPPPLTIVQDQPLPEAKSRSDHEHKAINCTPTDARLISILTAFLIVHPLGATLDCLVTYVRSIIPKATQSVVHNVLKKFSDVFSRKKTGVGANIENRWTFLIYENIIRSDKA